MENNDNVPCQEPGPGIPPEGWAKAVPVYSIRVLGHLNARRAAWFEGMTLTQEEGGITLIAGPIPDQAALHGILAKVRDLGLVLLSVNLVDIPT